MVTRPSFNNGEIEMRAQAYQVIAHHHHSQRIGGKVYLNDGSILLWNKEETILVESDEPTPVQAERVMTPEEEAAWEQAMKELTVG